jgi:hypothetical protein
VIQLNLFDIPAGNHINLMRKIAHTPQLNSIVIERTKFSADTDPTVKFRLDDFSGAWTTGVLNAPHVTPNAASYVAHWVSVNEMAKRAQVQITLADEDKGFELQNVGFAWEPQAGV